MPQTTAKLMNHLWTCLYAVGIERFLVASCQEVILHEGRTMDTSQAKTALEIYWTQWMKTEAKTAAESLGQAINKIPE